MIVKVVQSPIPTTEKNTIAFLEFLKKNHIGNNGDDIFTAQEIRDVFVVEGIPEASFETWAYLFKEGVLAFHAVDEHKIIRQARSAYNYIQKNHAVLLQRAPTTPEHTVTAHTKVTTREGSTLYLYQPLAAGSFFYALDSEGKIIKEIVKVPPGSQRHSYSGYTPSSAVMAEEEMATRSFHLSLDTLAPLASKILFFSGMEEDDHHGNLCNYLLLSFDSPMEHLSDSWQTGLLLDSEEVGASLDPHCNYQDYVIPSSTAGIDADSIGEGSHQVTLKFQNELGGTTTATGILNVKRAMIAIDNASTPLFIYNNRPDTTQDEAAIQMTERLLRESLQCGIRIKGFSLFLNLGSPLQSIVDSNTGMVNMPVTTETENWEQNFKDIYYHEVEGHSAFDTIPNDVFIKFNTLYKQLVTLDKKGSSFSPIPELATYNTPDSHEYTGLKSHMTHSFDVSYDIDNCALAVFQDEIYTGIPNAGHPWDSNHELFASTRAIIRRGDKDKLIANINKELSGSAQELALQVIDTVEQTM